MNVNKGKVFPKTPEVVLEKDVKKSKNLLNQNDLQARKRMYVKIVIMLSISLMKIILSMIRF